MDTGDSTPATKTTRRKSRRRSKQGNRSEISAATRIDILKSASAAFRKLGYHGATVEKIAAALQMNKGNLYYYFKSKEEILFACHEYSHDRLQELLDETVRGTAPADAKLRRLIHAAVHVILDELHGTALLVDLEALTPAHRRAVIHRRDKFDRGMRLIIEEGMATGVFKPERSEAARLRDAGRHQLDRALVQPGRAVDVRRGRDALRRLPHRRTPADLDISTVTSHQSPVAPVTPPADIINTNGSSDSARAGRRRGRRSPSG